MKNATKRLLASLCMGGIVSSVGCLAPESEGDSSVVDDDALGTDSQALGEVQCASRPATWDVTLACALATVGASCTSSAPNGDYAWVADECPGQWNVKVNIPQSPIVVEHSAEWIGTPLTTQALCESARMTVAGYYFDPNGNMYRLSGTAKSKGSWSGSSCSFVPDGTPGTKVVKSLTCSPQHGCQRPSQTTVKAWRSQPILGIPEPVRARTKRTG